MATAASNEIGRECAKHGIEPSMLISSDSVPEVHAITNGLVLELARFKDKHRECTFKHLYGWIKDLFGTKWPEQAPNQQALTQSVKRLAAGLSRLKKLSLSSEKEAKITEYLHCEFVLPQLGFHHGKVVKFSAPRAPTKDEQQLKKQMYSITRNANKRLKRREETIAKQKECIESQSQKIKVYEKKLQGAETKLSELRAKISRVNHRATYWRARVDSFKEQTSVKKTALLGEIEELKEKVSELDLDNAELNETIEMILSSEDVTTFEGGKYTDDVRACVYELLSLNVGVRNIAPIIRCVMKNIAHKSVNRLPSHGLTCQMILESLMIAQAQLGEKLGGGLEYNTLQTDGTTKYGEHYATYDVKTSEDQTAYTLGLRHIFSGSAVNTLDTFKEILDDIDCVQQAIGKDAVSAKIVTKIKNTMSDRHSAEKLFNELLFEYREELLPTVAENWDQMTDIEKEQLTRMNNFFCGLHYIVGLAECAEATLKVWEAQSTEEGTPNSSSTQRLVRTACKAFHHRGSQQCGTSTLFRAYMRKLGVHKIPLAHFVGNRFNIIFYDGGGVYYLRDQMIKFIESVHGKEANRLLQAVLSDLKDPVNIAGCRALGLIDKVVTGPLWRKVVESSASILQMSSVYSRVKARFDDWNDDSSNVLQGNDFLEDCPKIHKDEVWDSLTESNEIDDKTQEVLQLLFGSFSSTTQRLLLDHLPGGVYNSVADPLMVKETASVPTTNIAPERDFAVLDRLILEKPNASLVALESMILYSHNKSSHWLEQKTDEERQQLLRAARNLAPVIRDKFNKRRLELERRQEEAVARKQQDIAKRELKHVQEKELLTKRIAVVGLWTSKAEVEGGLSGLGSKADKVYNYIIHTHTYVHAYLLLILS